MQEYGSAVMADCEIAFLEIDNKIHQYIAKEHFMNMTAFESEELYRHLVVKAPFKTYSDCVQAAVVFDSVNPTYGNKIGIRAVQPRLEDTSQYETKQVEPGVEKGQDKKVNFK